MIIAKPSSKYSPVQSLNDLRVDAFKIMCAPSDRRLIPMKFLLYCPHLFVEQSYSGHSIALDVPVQA
jgi:hypothetical protein